MSELHWIKGDCVVPAITDEVLAERFAKYKPVVFNAGDYYSIDCPDTRQFLRNTAFTWSPANPKKVKFTPLKSCNTNHLTGYIGFFKPSVAEILAQLPDDVPEEANCFCIDMDSVSCYDSGDGHMAVTTFGVMKEIK